MFIALSQPYAPRPIRFIELWSVEDYRVKVYGIARPGETARGALVSAAKTVASGVLCQQPTRQTTYGVGFLGIHDGEGSNQVFLDRWINENELMHQVFISPPDQPTELSPPPDDYNSVCVWDLYVQCFERRAWIEHVLNNPSGPDLDAYVGARLNEDV